MKSLFPYLAPYGKRMGVGLSIKIGGTIVELFLPLILNHILDDVILTHSVPQVVLWGGIMILCAGFACACNIIANRMAASTSKDFAGDVRRALFAKTLYLGARDTDRFTIPSLESRITSDTYNVHSFVSVMQRMGVRAPILLIGGMSISFFLDPVLALVMLAMSPFIFCLIYFVARRGVPLYREVQARADSLVRVVREDMQGIRVIKALSTGAYENARYDEVNRALSKSERHAGTVMGAVNPLMNLSMNLGIVAVVALSALRVARGTSTPATVIAFIQYFTLISMAMMALSRIFVMYTKASASARRIGEVLETPERFFVTPAARDAATEIEFRDVSFSYLGKKDNLANISFSLARGQSLGIIGATGSGKTTLLSLLMRAYDADSGVIFLAGRPITSYPRDELAALFGVALQHDFLAADTIAENIRFGRPLSDAAVERAAKIAQLHDFITTLADGYNHTLSPRGTNLSGGQRQRLLIARAVAANPRILIFDDASSALDYQTDSNLRKALRAAYPDTTSVTVAQRVSSVKDCDLILYLEEGRILGAGTHDELLTTCTPYREMADSQMGGVLA